ncbi:MAG: hypothetical protein ACPG1C_08615 [Alphaproteobacteria bacterium]
MSGFSEDDYTPPALPSAFWELNKKLRGAWFWFYHYVCFCSQNFHKRDWLEISPKLSGLKHRVFLSYSKDAHSDLPICYIEYEGRIFPLRLESTPTFLFSSLVMTTDELAASLSWMRKRAATYRRFEEWLPEEYSNHLGLLSDERRLLVQDLLVDKSSAADGSMEPKHFVDLRKSAADEVTFASRVYSALALGREWISFWFKADNGWELTPIQPNSRNGIPYVTFGVSKMWDRGLLRPCMKVKFKGRQHQIVICEDPYFRFGVPRGMPQEHIDQLYRWIKEHYYLLIGLWRTDDGSNISSIDLLKATSDRDLPT